MSNETRSLNRSGLLGLVAGLFAIAAAWGDVDSSPLVELAVGAAAAAAVTSSLEDEPARIFSTSLELLLIAAADVLATGAVWASSEAAAAIVSRFGIVYSLGDVGKSPSLVVAAANSNGEKRLNTPKNRRPEKIISVIMMIMIWIVDMAFVFMFPSFKSSFVSIRILIITFKLYKQLINKLAIQGLDFIVKGLLFWFINTKSCFSLRINSFCIIQNWYSFKY